MYLLPINWKYEWDGGEKLWKMTITKLVMSLTGTSPTLRSIAVTGALLARGGDPTFCVGLARLANSLPTKPTRSPSAGRFSCAPVPTAPSLPFKQSMRTSSQPEVHAKSHLGSPAFHLHASQTAGLLGALRKPQ